MTTEAPKIGSQIIAPNDVTDAHQMFETIANRDKEIAERIEELDDLIEAILTSTGTDFLLSFNKLSNPGFETLDSGSDTFDSWSETGFGPFSAETTLQQSGDRAAKVFRAFGVMSGDDYFSQSFTPEDGAKYSLQFWSYGEFTAPRYMVYQTAAPLIGLTSTGHTGSWHLTEDTFVANGTDAIAIRLYNCTNNGEAVFFDDVLVMKEVTYAQVNTYIGQLLKMIAQILGHWS